MANSIFYEAGCRAALVKLGATDPHDPLYFLESKLPATMSPSRVALSLGAHGLGGGVAGAGVGALLSPGDRAAGAAAGALLGGGAGLLGKSLANSGRIEDIENEAAQRNLLLRDYLHTLKNAPSPEASQQFYDALGKRNTEIGRLKGKVEGFGY